MFISTSSRFKRPDESTDESIVWRVASAASPFVDKQGQSLAFIHAYGRIFRRPPAEADMQRHFRVTPPTVHQMVLTLERAGLIRRQPGSPAASNSSYRGTGVDS
jgi:DNA-binding MarR family transcriptional regulator